MFPAGSPTQSSAVWRRMEARRIILCFAPENRPSAAAAAEGLAAAGFDCRLSGPATDALTPGYIRWADVMVVLLSATANGSERILRDVEEAVTSGLRIVPVHLDGTAPSSALRYYLGPFQWVEPGPDGGFLDPLLEALSETEEELHPNACGGKRRGAAWTTGRAVTVIAVAVVLSVLALFGLRPGADPVPEPRAAVPAVADSFDILVAGPAHTTELQPFLASLGYTLETAEELPDSGLGRYDMVLLCLDGDPGRALVLHDYLCAGGAVLLQGGQPYFLGMPGWIGMGTYSNFWGAGFPVTATTDSLPGMEGARAGDVLLYYEAFMDGGAVLKNPTTALVDACYDGVDSLAGAIRNTVGSGRVAWLAFNPHPFANATGNEYSTDAYQRYLVALYAWLDRDGPEGIH